MLIIRAKSHEIRFFRNLEEDLCPLTIKSTLSYFLPKTELFRNARQTPSDLSQIKIRTKLKDDTTRLSKRHISNNYNVSKELWFPGMGADFIKQCKVYRLITGKQYQKLSFQLVKITLFKLPSCINYPHFSNLTRPLINGINYFAKNEGFYFL